MRIAIMCAEKNPIDCHRTILVGRELVERELKVVHILADGQTQTQVAVIDSLAEKFGLRQPTLFGAAEDLTAEVYTRQEKRIAFQINARGQTLRAGRK